MSSQHLWRRLRGLVLIGLGLVAAALLYLIYLNPLSGEEIVPAGHARNTSSYVPMRDGTRLAHLRAAVDPRRPGVHLQGDLEEQLCVPLLVTEGDSIRLTDATRGKGVKPLTEQR